MRKIIITLVFLLLISGTILGAEEELRGRDFVERGELQIIKGTLLYRDDEWFLATEIQDTVFEVHLGDHDHQQEIGLDLQEGDNIILCGYRYENDIATVIIVTETETYHFRTIEGSPLWAGEGQNINRNELDPDEDWIQDDFGD